MDILARRIESVEEIDFTSMKEGGFDLGIFSCGFETRCTSLALAIDRKKLRRCLVFGFETFGDDPQRIANDKLMYASLRKSQTKVSGYDHEVVLLALKRAVANVTAAKKILRVLIDYSSMTKTLYSTILSFFALHRMECDIELTFSYTIGEHVEFDIANQNMGTSRITEIIALPGFEGALPRAEGMTAIFGLGFETLKPISVAERLETQSMMAFFADPGAFPDYAAIALQRNEQFIQNYLKREPLRFPIRQPTALYRALGEIVAPYVERDYQNVQLVPLGPKPHVLASLLVAIKYPVVTVLQVSSARAQPEVVKPLVTDPFVITQVAMVREQ